MNHNVYRKDIVCSQFSEVMPSKPAQARILENRTRLEMKKTKLIEKLKLDNCIFQYANSFNFKFHLISRLEWTVNRKIIFNQTSPSHGTGTQYISGH